MIQKRKWNKHETANESESICIEGKKLGQACMQRMKEDQVFDIKNESEGSFDESC